MPDIIPINRNLKLQSTQNINIDFFTTEEIEAMFNYISEKINTDKTHRKRHEMYFALFNTLLYTGGRIHEVLALTPSDFNLATNTVKLPTLKQKKNKRVFRYIPLHPKLKEVILQYFLVNKIDLKSTDRIFPIRESAVTNYMYKMQEKLGFKIHPHKFRHTFGVMAIMGHVPLSVLQEWMGHSSIFTTSVYTRIAGMDTSSFISMMDLNNLRVKRNNGPY